jgi:hypothetical protein
MSPSKHLGLINFSCYTVESTAKSADTQMDFRGTAIAAPRRTIVPIWVALAAIAARTKRLRLGLVITPVARSLAERDEARDDQPVGVRREPRRVVSGIGTLSDTRMARPRD